MSPRANVPDDVQDAVNRVLDRIHDGFIAYDREWRITHLNRRAEAYLGAPRESLIGRDVWAVFPQAVGSLAWERLRAAAASGAPSEYEGPSPVTGRWIAFRVYPSEEGLSVYFHDVTERHEAEAALRASEERYRSVFENSLHGILMTVPTGDILAANPAACRMLGRTEEELRAAGRAGVVDAADPGLTALLEERARTGRARGELRLVRKDGTTFPAEVTSSVFRGSDGAERTSLSFTDLTERKRGEAALEFLAEASAALGASLEYERTLEALTRVVVT